MEVYRITQEFFARDLTGNGARLYGGRWNSEGVFALYASESRSLALLENIVHTPIAIFREKIYLIVSIYIPDDAGIRVVDAADLPQSWDAFDANPVARNYGDAFFKRAEHLLLKVPSVLMPEEFNYILNPLMPAMKAVKIIKTRQLIFNDRLLQDF